MVSVKFFICVLSSETTWPNVIRLAYSFFVRCTICIQWFLSEFVQNWIKTQQFIQDIWPQESGG